MIKKINKVICALFGHKTRPLYIKCSHLTYECTRCGEKLISNYRRLI